LAKKQASFLNSGSQKELNQPDNESHVDCVICLSSSSSRPHGQLVYMSFSPICAFNPRPFIDVSNALIPADVTSNFLPFQPNANGRVITRTCGHRLHVDCWESLSNNGRVTHCPYCNRPANALLGVDSSDPVLMSAETVLAKLYNDRGGLHLIVSAMNDLIDQIALSSRYPCADTDLHSLTCSVPLLLWMFREKLESMLVPNIESVFEKTRFLLQRCMYTKSGYSLEIEKLFVSEFTSNLTSYFSLIDVSMSAETRRRVSYLLMRPWLFRAHLLIHHFLIPTHELPFEEIYSINDVLNVEDEFNLLVNQLPFGKHLQAALADITSMERSIQADKETPTVKLPAMIVDTRSTGQMKPQFFESYIKREKVKWIDIPESTIKIVEYLPTVIPILPSIYQKLYTWFLHAKCVACNSVPRLPVVCLLCGQLLCSNSQCCATVIESPPSSFSSFDSNQIGEVTHHFSILCAPNGIGVFLQLSNSVVYLVGDKGTSVAHWGSLYLDSHGEEDYGLSKPLQLDVSGRLERLRSELRENSFIWKHGAKNFQWKPVSFL
jgi:hypothetical protein